MNFIFASIASLTTAYMLFTLLFESREEFFECVKFWFTPDIVSALRGNYFEGSWAEFKLWIWIVASVLVGYGTYQLFS